MQGIEIIYDGECPFCGNFVRLMNLKKTVGPVALIDARSPHPTPARLTALGYDLNEGMAAIHGGKIYHGADAVILLSALAEPGLLAAILRNPRRANLLYPWLKRGRALTLRLLGKPPL